MRKKMIFAANSMQTNQIMLMANVNRSQIEITNTHYKIKSIPITVDDAVMNDVHYSAAENAKGMPSMQGNPVTLGHPVIDGQNVSGSNGGGLDDHYSGGTVSKVYNKSGVWYINASIKKSILNAQDGGKEYADMLENKDSIGVSTGLMFEDNELAGVNATGKSYSKSAVNQTYDHLAMLANEAPAGGEDTVMRFNVADVMPQDSWASKAWNAVKSVFKSNENSFDEIRDKIYQKLNEGLSNDVCGRYPHDVWADHFVYRGENDKLYKQSYALIDDEVTFIDSPVEVERVIEYETVTNTGENIMDRTQIIGLLSGKGISVNADISDADLMAKLTEAVNGEMPEQLKKKAKAKKAEGDEELDEDGNPIKKKAKNAEEVPAWAQAFMATVNESLATNHNIELDSLKTQAKAMKTNRLSDSVIDKCDAQELKDHLAANGQVGFNVSGGQHVNSTKDDGGYSADMPE